MTYEERMKQVCDTCANHKNTCGYRCRGLNDKCEYLQTIMEGWELGQEDVIKSLWKDAQGDDLPEIDREVIALQGRKVVFAHRPNTMVYDYLDDDTLELKHFQNKTYDKGGWNMEGITYWLDALLPKDIE